MGRRRCQWRKVRLDWLVQDAEIREWPEATRNRCRVDRIFLTCVSELQEIS